MDEGIRNLADFTDETTKHILQGVVNKKRKFEKFKRYHLIVMWLTVSTVFLYLLYLNETIFTRYTDSFEAGFSAFVNAPANSYLLVFTVGLYGFMNVLKKKMDKYEDEYHALRKEIIAKSPDLWKRDEAWEKRHIVFEFMKKTYDINLYHENK